MPVLCNQWRGYDVHQSLSPSLCRTATTGNGPFYWIGLGPGYPFNSVLVSSEAINLIGKSGIKIPQKTTPSLPRILRGRFTNILCFHTTGLVVPFRAAGKLGDNYRELGNKGEPTIPLRSLNVSRLAFLGSWMVHLHGYVLISELGMLLCITRHICPPWVRKRRDIPSRGDHLGPTGIE